MPISHISDNQLIVQEEDTQEVSLGKTKYKNNDQSHQELSYKQKQKQNALELAELIYDIFHSTLSSATMDDENRKDNQNDQ